MRALSRSRSSSTPAQIAGLVVAVLAVIGLGAGPAHADPVCTSTWVGAATGGTWSTATNWSPAAVPTAADTACIPSGTTVTVSATASVHDLQAAGAIVKVQSGTLGLTDAATISYAGGLLQTGGTVTVSGALHVTSTFGLSNSATLSGAGAVVVDSGATGTIADGVLNGVTLRNDGSLVQTGYVPGSNGAVLDNRGTYTMNTTQCGNCYESGLIASGSGALPVLRNTGTFQRTGGAAGAPGTVSFGFDNDGVVAIQAGPVRFTRSAAGETSTGSWSGLLGGSVAFAGAVALGGGAALDGAVSVTAGTLTVPDIQGPGATVTVQGGTLSLTDPTAVSHVSGLAVNQSNSTLTVAGELRVANAFAVAGSGVLSGTGSVVVASGATGTIADGVLNGVTLRNDGSVVQTGHVPGSNGAVLDNRGTYIMNTTQCGNCYETGLVAAGSGALPLLRNTGTFRRTGGQAGLAGTVSFGMDNDGVVAVQAGSVRFTKGAPGETSTGSWSGTSGGTVTFGGTWTLGSGIPLDGAVTVASGATVTAGDLQGPDAAVVLQGGTLTLSDPAGVSHVSALTMAQYYTSALHGAGRLQVSNTLALPGTGTLAGTGTVVLESGGTGTIGGVTVDGFTLRNDGQVTQSDYANLYGKNGAVLDNRGTYTLNPGGCAGCSYPGILWTPNGDQAPRIHNTGTFQRTTGIASYRGVVSWGMDNDGSVSVAGGPVQFTRGVAGESSTGSWAGSSGGTPILQGAFSWGTGSAVMGRVTVGQGAAVSATEVQGPDATVALEGGTLTLADPAGVSHLSGLDFTLNSASTLAGSGQLRVADELTLGNGGVMSGTGTVVLGSGANSTVSSGTIDGFTLRNDGTVTHAGEVSLTGRNGAVLDNRGTYILNTDRCQGCWTDPGLIWTPNGDAQPQVHNSGTLVRTTGIRSATVSWGFDNSGTVDIGGSSRVWFTRGAGGLSSTGTWRGAGAGVPTFSGPFTLGAGTTFDGPIAIWTDANVAIAGLQGQTAALDNEYGTLTLDDGDGLSVVKSLVQSGGGVTGPGRLDVTDAFALDHRGTLSGGGSIVVGAQATGTVGDYTVGDFTLRNDGSLSQSGVAILRGRTGAVVDNRGTYTLNTERCAGCGYDPGLILDTSNNSPVFVNRGVFQKTQGTGETRVEWPFDNRGEIRTLAPAPGHLKFYGPFVGTAPAPEESYGPGSPAARGLRRSCAGRPVDCATGNQFEVQTDLTVGGRGPGLAVTRTYNSQAAADASAPGRFGYGWTATYGDRLVVEAAQHRATVHGADGAAVPFIIQDNGSITAPAWIQAKLVHNSGGTYTYTLPDQSREVFDADGRPTSVADRNGNAIDLTYDGSHRLVTATDPGGRTLTYTYNGDDQVETVTDPSGLVAHYSYDDGELTEVRYGGDADPTWTFGYDSAHQLTSMTDARGHTTTTAYDAQHRAISQTDALDRTRTWDYLADETKVTEPNGSVTDITFANGQPKKIVRAQGTAAETTQELVYDDAFRTLEVTDGNGHTTTFTYDADGNRKSAVDPTGRKVEWTYNSTHDVMTAKTNAGITTTIGRDGNGNPTTVSRTFTDGGGTHTQTVTNGYDAHGLLTSLKDALNHETTFDYNTRGDQIGSTLPNGQTTTRTFDADSRVLTTVAPRGNESGATPADHTTTIERDKFGRVTKVTDPLGRETRTTYDANGNVTEVEDSAGRESHATYDAEDQLTDEELGDGSTRHVSYDAMGNVATRTDGRGKVTTYHYDEAGNQTEVIDPLNRGTTRTFDDAGNVTSEVDAMGRTTTFTYDDADRPKTIAYPAPNAFDVTYTYNADGERASMTDATGVTTYGYDGLGRLSTVHTGTGKDLSYEYDLADRRTAVTYPNGHTVTSSYDASGRMESVEDWLGNTTEFGFDADGNLTQTDFPTTPATSDTATYDDAGQLSDVSLGETGGSAPQLGYQYGPGGELSQVTSAHLPGTSGTDSFEYDDAGRLSKENLAQVAYDLAGQVTTLPSGDQLAYDDAGQLTTRTLAGGAGTVTFGYDDVGQRVSATPSGGGAASTYAYDGAGRLRSASVLAGGGSETYDYDGDGLRVASHLGSTATSFTWDPAGGDLVAENGTSYLYGPDGLPFEEIDSSDAARFYHHDRLGSIRSVTDDTGARIASQTFDAYGNVTGSTGSSRIPFGFAGQYTDSSTGLVYMRARYYDPQTGQFLTRDPLEQLTEQAYQYADNDPVNAIDPLGLLSIHIGLPSLQDVSDAAAGFGDSATFGLTGKIRQALGVDNVNYCSAAYGGGSLGGTAIQLAIPVERLVGVGVKLAAEARAAKGLTWAEKSGILRDAAVGKGNYGLGSATSREAAALGRDWVGEGYTVASDGKTLVSADGMRQYRPPTAKLSGRYQANFERRFPGQKTRQWQGNGHLDITD